jgi:hypothetical protein
MKEYLTRKFLTAGGIYGWRRLLGCVSAGKEVVVMRTYKAFVFVPSVLLIEAKNDEDARKKVAEVYKGYYTNEFPDWIEPLIQPADVT